ncbi:MAG: TolC family protein [Desulfobacterales bacterium]|nr:MAG: TolC family protein [Desulfobacterales bacterium]
MWRFSIKVGGIFFVGLTTISMTYRSPLAASLIWAPPTLNELIEEGLVQNKEIQSLEAQVESLKAEIPFAGALDDPRLGFAILNLPADSFSFDEEPMTQKQISIAQRIPWFGKLDLRSQKATLKAIRQQAMLEAKRLELARKIAVAYYEFGFINRSLEINQRLTEIVSQLLRFAETRYATGRGLQQDVLQAQVELSKLLDEKITLEKRRRTLTDRINELLNRERFMAVERPTGLEFMSLQLNAEELTSMALQENPQLRVKQAEIDMAQVEIELAKKDYWPDLEFMLAYGQRDEDRTGRSLPDFISGQVLMNIPLWQKTRQDPKLAATQKAREAAEKSYWNLVKSLPFQLDALITEIRDTQENYKLFKDALLLQADQWARSSQAAYEVGSVEFNTMINAQIRLLQFELKADKYLFNIYKKRAELEEVLGGSM